MLGDEEIVWSRPGFIARLEPSTRPVWTSPGRPCRAAAPLLPRLTEQDRPPASVEAADLFEPVLVGGGQIGFGELLGESAQPFGEVLGAEARVAADGEL